MKITRLKTNHMQNPLGYHLGFGAPTLSWVIEDQTEEVKMTVRVAEDPDFKQVLSEETVDTCAMLCYQPPVEPKPRTRYYWQVEAAGVVSETAWFETGKMYEPWTAQWISPVVGEGQPHPVLNKTINVKEGLTCVRLYMTGLGVYELYINGAKKGDEYLMPGYNDYDTWIQYQTYDLTEELSAGGEAQISVLLGNGWYKGLFGLVYQENNYGDRFSAIGELHLAYQDGSEEVIITDESWTAESSCITASSIYDGETQDYTLEKVSYPVEVIEGWTDRLQGRLSPALNGHERITPVQILKTKKGETVLDMGQNMVGWPEFYLDAPKGWTIGFKTGELLQDDCFYRDNLRRSKSEFSYTSDGTPRVVRPHFTFYGFRYVLLENWPTEPKAEDFCGLVIHSDMEETGCIQTSDPRVNQLLKNVRWGQKGNFLDVPTDCPQRDERMGWTGDAQVFCGTASFNYDTYEFYTKFGHDLYYEQQKLDGSVPHVVPVVNNRGDGSTAWGEAATVIPWQVYVHFGDPEILKNQYNSMKDWVDFMERKDKESGRPGLWDSGFHFADWLALDGPVEGGVMGGTDPYMIASCYYSYSAKLVAKAAHVLGKAEDEAYYNALSERVRKAVCDEYLTPNGKLAMDTMTAYVVMLFMDIAPEKDRARLAARLYELLKENNFHLKTGFVGTPYLCRVLSENGYNDVAYQLLMNDDYPSWLYEVKMGATTIWERWNSVLPDGKISGIEMNSMNHYAYGSIAEWVYRNAAGIQPDETETGFRRFTLAPQPDYRLQWIDAHLNSSCGPIRSYWKIEDPEHLHVEFTVPYGTKATIVLPDANAEALADGFTQQGTSAVKTVDAGTYAWTYTLTRVYRKMFTLDSFTKELFANEEAKQAVLEVLPGIERMPFAGEMATLRDMLDNPFMRVPDDVQEALEQKLKAIII